MKHMLVVVASVVAVVVIVVAVVVSVMLQDVCRNIEQVFIENENFH